MEIIHLTAPSIRAMKTNDQMQSGRTIKARTEAGNARKCSNRYLTFFPAAINITCDALSYNFIITRLINLPIRSTHRATKAGPNPHSLCISRHCCVRSTSIYTFFVGRKKKSRVWRWIEKNCWKSSHSSHTAFLCCIYDDEPRPFIRKTTSSCDFDGGLCWAIGAIVRPVGAAAKLIVSLFRL